MSSNLGMIISMFFVVAFLLLGGDMTCLSAAYNELDSISITIGYIIAKNARVDQEFITVIEDRYDVNFMNIAPQNPAMGDVVEYVIYRDYNPLILSKDPIRLCASRTTVIGYYG